MAASPLQQAKPVPRVPALIAHRGHTACCPENTLSALKSAADCGASYVEVDVQLSADRVPVLFHDDTLDRICGVTGPVHGRDWASLSTLRASDTARLGRQFAGEPLASLADLARLLRRRPGLTAFIEAKDIAIDRFGAGAVLHAITAALDDVAGQYVLISFSLAFLELARAQSRQPLGVVIECWEERDQPRLRALRPEYLFCDRNGLPPAGSLAVSGGTRIAVYEVADGDEALALAARGADLVETFAVGAMLRFMQARTTAGTNDE
jgi:glycerophosphoryl diester phosphodiesterase